MLTSAAINQMKQQIGNPQFNKAYYPFLLTVFFVLNGCVQNFPLAPFKDALLVAVGYIAITFLLLVIFYAVFRSLEKSAFFSFILMGLQFFFGWFHDLLKAWLPTSFISKYSVVLPLVLFGALLVFFLIKRKDRISPKLVRYLNATLAILIFLEAIMLAVKALRHSSNTSPQNFVACTDCAKPNIYFIVADEYAGNSSLADLFSFDNSGFENELRKKDFFVASHSSSNYNFTPYSMASIFSMNYLEGITARSNDRKNLNLCFQRINDNELVRILKKFDYEFVNLSLFDFAGQPNMSAHNDFYSGRAQLITSQTLTSRLKKDLMFHLAYTLKLKWAYNNYLDNLKNDLEYQYNKTIKESQGKGRPRFVYTHFIMPHYPYLYDEKGNALSIQQALNGGKKEYLGYLQFGNRKYLSLIDSIKKYDRTNPVIIVMSDHGFTKYNLNDADTSYNFKSIFNIYMPGKKQEPFPDSVSSVNVFRIFLNAQFKQNLPLLADSSFFLSEY